MSAEARLLRRLVNELRDIDEAYWTHRLFGLVDEADALLANPTEDAESDTASRVLAAFNGGMVCLPDQNNPRGYVTVYRPAEAMTQALAKAGVPCPPPA